MSERPPTRVAFLTIGGITSEEQIRDTSNALAESLNKEVRAGWKDNPKMFDARVFGELIPAEQFLAHEGVLVFMSISLESNAKKFARENTGVRVVLLTGQPTPIGEPFIVPKRLVNHSNLKEIFQ